MLGKFLLATGLALVATPSPGSVPMVRPPAMGFFDASALPLRVHYADGVDPTYAQTVLKTAEQAWTRMFIEMGFLAPLPDRGEGGSTAFDIYLVTSLQPGIGGYTSFSGFNDETPRADAYGYVVFAHDLKPRYIRGVVAHELFHASQMAYDWWEDVSFMEASSTWIVDHVFDDEDLYWKYYSWYNRQPWKALDFISLADPYQYGAGLFLQFLDERYGAGDGALVRSVWELCVQNDSLNEPDYFDAIDAVLRLKGETFEAAFHEFGEWRIFVGPRDDGQHFAEGGSWGPDMAVPFAADLTWQTGQSPVNGQLEHPLQPYSHAFFRVSSISTIDLPRSLALSTEPSTRLQVRWLVRDAGGSTICGGDSPLLPGGGTAALLDGCARLNVLDNAETPSELLVYVTNLADGAYDTESPVWTESPVAWEFH